MTTVRTLPNGNSLTITAKLHGQKPYFSITAVEKEKGREISWGCQHESILQVAPELRLIVDLHLSTEDGMPMHAVANGLYWLMNGCILGKEWKTSDQTEEKSLQFAADHFRISLTEAQELRDKVRCEDREKANESKIVTDFVESQKGRWKEQARQVIETFNLKITA